MKVVALILFAMVSSIQAQYPDTFLGSLAMGNGFSDICISPDGNRAYAAVGFGFAVVIDIEGYDEFTLATIVPIDGEPSAVQCDETGEILYVSDSENSLVHVVNTASLTLEYSFSVQPWPVDMLLVPGHGRIFLAHSQGMITVINTETGYPEEVFWAGESLNGLCVSPDGAFICAADNESSQESIINPENSRVNRVNSGMDSRSAAVSSDGSRLFFSCTAWNMIGVMDRETLTMETTIACEASAPVWLTSLPGLPWLYGAHPSDNLLSVHHSGDLTLQGTVDVPGQPSRIAVHPDGERLFVVCDGDNRVRVYGFDPEGVENVETALSISPALSPAVRPSVRVTAGEGGPVTLRGHDLAGRTVWRENVVLSPGESRVLQIEPRSAGMVFVTAAFPGGTRRTSVVVLKP